MLDEAAKHIREGILLGRTDIIKKLLDEVKQTIKSEKAGLQFYLILTFWCPGICGIVDFCTFLYERTRLWDQIWPKCFIFVIYLSQPNLIHASCDVRSRVYSLVVS